MLHVENELLMGLIIERYMTDMCVIFLITHFFTHFKCETF